MATVGTLSKTCSHASGSPRRHPQLLPHQGTFRSGGSHQRQHQNPSQQGPWLQESRLSTAQGPTHGGHQDRIHRSSESRLKCGSLRILVQSRFFLVTEEGRKLLFRWLGPGDLFGGRTILSKPSSYLFSTETVTDGSALVWDRPTIRSFVERNPRLLENALLTASD